MTQALINAIEGRKNSRYPTWFLRQAGRYLPEYRKLREGRTFVEMCSDPKLAAEVTLQPLRRFDLDAAIIFADILLILMPLGQDLSFKKDHGPILAPPVRNREDFDRLNRSNPPLGDLAYVGEAISLVRNQLPQDKSVIGFAGAPFTVASYMIEGGGTKNFHNLKRMVFSESKLFHDIMKLLTESTKTYLKMQADAGCDLMMLFDSWAAALSPKDYEKHVLSYMKDLKSFISSLDKKLIFFPGQNPQHANLVTKEHCDVLHLPWQTDLEQLFDGSEISKKGLCFQGNLDPQALFLDEESLRGKVRSILDFFEERAPGRHIFNIGHGLIPQTPIKSLEIAVDEIRKGL